MVDALTGTSSLAPQTASKATSAGLGLAEDFDTFLKLLTVQLQNQDPTDPMDTNEFTRQIVEFTNVEQAVATNTNLEKLISLVQQDNISTAAAYIGKSVETLSDDVALQDSIATFSYELDEAAVDTTISITDTTGRVLYSTKGETGAGRHDLVWDGSDQNGNPLPDGLYKVIVKATEGDGETEVGSRTYTSGIVSEVRMQNGETVLGLGELDVPLASVIAVRNAVRYVYAGGPGSEETGNSSATDSSDAAATTTGSEAATSAGTGADETTNTTTNDIS